MDEINSKDQNNWAGGVHVAAIALAVFTSWSAGVGGMVAGLVVWLMKKDDSALVRKHAADAFNFHLAMFLIMLATWVFVILGVTTILNPLLAWGLNKTIFGGDLSCSRSTTFRNRNVCPTR